MGIEPSGDFYSSWSDTLKNLPTPRPTVDDINPAVPEGPQTVGVRVDSSLWV